MRKTASIVTLSLLVCAALALAVAAQGQTYQVKFTPRCTNGLKMIPDKSGWEYKPGRPLTIEIPDMPLSDAEKEKLYAGQPVCKMLPGAGEKKIGWLRFFVPFDPVTAYWVITDSDKFSQQDPSFPATGSLTRKRNTFMPYCFDNAVCEHDGMMWNLQYLVMPLVSPRKVCTSLCRNRDAFPWESAWWSNKEFLCEDQIEPELQAELKEAVPVTQNRGAWHVGPLPPEFRRKPEDLNRAEILYIVDTEPGGTLGNAQSIVNAANEKALPNLAANVTKIGARWEWFMKKFHSPEDLRRFKAEQAEYRRVWGPQFKAQ